MNRRELLKKSVVASLGLGLAPGLLMSLESCSKARPTTDQPVYLSQEHFDTIWQMAELILPTTDSPGAHEAGVAPFIDQLFGEYFEDAYVFNGYLTKEKIERPLKIPFDAFTIFIDKLNADTELQNTSVDNDAATLFKMKKDKYL